MVLVEPLLGSGEVEFLRELHKIGVEENRHAQVLRITGQINSAATSLSPVLPEIETTLAWPVQGDVLRATVDLSLRLGKALSALNGARQELKTQADNIEQKIAERTSALRDSISQMEEFSYTVSHDLRAPLRSIKGYAEVLLTEYSHRLRGEGPHYLERIIDSGDRMEKLVNDVLKISRISSSQLSLQPVDLNILLDRMIREYPSLSAEAAQISVEKIPLVIGQESLCTQIFANLLGNAVKFVRQGMVPKIRISGYLKGDVVRIIVSDNGIGISPEFHQKIFGMFERLDPDNRYGGTGIGLAIVRRAAEKMNGKVGLESDGRSGSRFWVELPAAL
ncbi:MAG TPA: HAMP domain-containing sensor histidine kinase [Opitutaceae bacterium]|nr:HAMP domain-containing sensor histidine kinase [Opitutaceae bacterium]